MALHVAHALLACGYQLWACLQVKRTQLYLTTLQMQIYIYRGNLAGAEHQLHTCISLTKEGAEYRPGFIRCFPLFDRAKC